MLRSDFCNRPNVTSTPRMIRFPSSPHFRPCDPSFDWDPSTASAVFGTTRVELRLTAILQLWRRSRPSWTRAEGLASVLARRWRRPVLAGAAIDSPSERRRPAAVFSTACRARHLTSDALCRAPRLPDRSPSSAESQTRFRRRLVKAGDFFEPERLPSTSVPFGDPPPCSRLRRREPASDADSLPVLPAVSHRGRRARPPHRCGGQAPLVDFCNQNYPRARAANRPIPGLVLVVAHPVAGAGGSCLDTPRTRGPVTLRHDPSRGFAGQGPAGFRRPAPLDTIARAESFAPTCLARTPRVVELVARLAG